MSPNGHGVCVIGYAMRILRHLASRHSLQADPPSLPRAAEQAAGWTGLGWRRAACSGPSHRHRRCYLDLRYTGCMYDLASSPGALLGLAIRVSPSLALSAGRRWPRLVDRFGDIVAGRGVLSPFRFFSMFISSLLVRVVVSHRRFFGMGCGAFLLASRPVVAGWDLQHRRRHALFHHQHFLPLSGIMSSTSFRSTSRTRST